MKNPVHTSLSPHLACRCQGNGGTRGGEGASDTIGKRKAWGLKGVEVWMGVKVWNRKRCGC